jgi:quinolinate synthase
MKTITVPKLYRALRDLVYEVTVPEPTAAKARRAIQHMVETV